jgi:hypothetical protein
MPSTQGRHLLVAVDAPTAGTDPFTAVRVLLVADVLSRFAAALQERTVTVARVHRGRSPPAVKGWATAIGVGEPTLSAPHLPAARLVDGTDSGPTYAVDPAVLVTSGPGQCWATSGRTITVARAYLDGWADPDDVWDRRANPDPLALRLALLRFSPSQDAQVSHARLRRAEETLRRWRLKVSDWRDLPSSPAPPDTRVSIHGHLAADLDTRAVLTLLHRLEIDHATPSGSKFSAFTTVDHVLALDLCRQTARSRI